jgi:molybdenum transport protein
MSDPASHPLLSTYRLPDSEIERFLQEDVPYGDLTTHLLGIGGRPGRISFSTRHETVVCCTEEAGRMLEKLGCTVIDLAPSGSLLGADSIMLQASGSAGSLHVGWRAALNLLESASGVATRTHVLVREARAVNPDVEVVSTRKVFSGTKAIATKAVLAGGGMPHRLGLSESLLVFAQHVVFLGSHAELWRRLAEVKTRAKEKKIGIEVDDLAAARAAAAAGADVVQVDKMGLDELTEFVSAMRAEWPGVLVAAAGGVNQSNAGAYAATGVDLLVTSSMYWGKPADISVRMEVAD